MHAEDILESSRLQIRRRKRQSAIVGKLCNDYVNYVLTDISPLLLYFVSFKKNSTVVCLNILHCFYNDEDIQ